MPSSKTGRSHDPYPLPRTNRVLGAPPDWNESHGPCVGLPIKVTGANEETALSSYWKPSAEELAQLCTGAKVKLTVYGFGHPAVWVGAEFVGETNP